MDTLSDLKIRTALAVLALAAVCAHMPGAVRAQEQCERVPDPPGDGTKVVCMVDFRCDDLGLSLDQRELCQQLCSRTRFMTDPMCTEFQPPECPPRERMEAGQCVPDSAGAGSGTTTGGLVERGLRNTGSPEYEIRITPDILPSDPDRETAAMFVDIMSAFDARLRKLSTETSKADKALRAFLKAGGTLAEAANMISVPPAIDFGLMLLEEITQGATKAAVAGFSGALDAVALPAEFLLNDAALRQLVGAAQKLTEADLLRMKSRVVDANRTHLIDIYAEYIAEREQRGDPVRVLVIIDN